MTLVKICGITNWHDAKAAVDAGADMLGFVCDANSERAVDVDAFLEMALRIPPRILRVGVFDQTAHQEWALRPEALRLFHLIQYYDNRIWPEVVGENWDMRRKIRAFHVSREADLRTIAQCNDLVQSYLINIHTEAAGNSAGLGNSDPQIYGWHIANEVHQFGKRLFLAGGLTPDNVGLAIKMVRPYAVDITVGVEVGPGVKDPNKMRAFIDAVRRASK